MIFRVRFQLFVALSLLAAVSLARAAMEMPLGDIEITAEKTALTEEEIVYSGDVQMRHGDALLRANEITYRTKEQKVIARGHATLTQTARRLVAEEVFYDVRTRIFSVSDFRLGQSPYFVTGENVGGNEDIMSVQNARVTYTEPSWYAPTLSAERVTFNARERTVRADGGWAGIGPFRPIPIASYDQPIDYFPFSEVSARVGFNSRLGAFFDFGALVPVSAEAAVGGSFGYYSKRGVLLGPGFSYKKRGGGLKGRFAAGYIHDNGDLGEDIAGHPVPEDRGFVTWEHRQLVGENVTLTGFVNYWSDSEVMRDFRRRNFRDMQTPDNFLEGTFVRPNYVLSVFTRFQTNSVYVVQQRLPEVRFDLLPGELVLGIQHRLNASVVFLNDNSLPDTVESRTGRADVYYGLSRTFGVGDWFALTPVAGARGTYYSDTNPGSGKSDYARALGQVGFDAELRASATSNYTNAKWHINGLRHLVTPRVSYRYIPSADKGTRYIPPIDRGVFTTYLDTLDLGDRRDIDELDPTNTVRLALDNVLQTRDDVYGSRDLLRLTLAMDYRFNENETAGRRDFSDLHVGFSLLPAHWISFEVYQNISTHDGNLNEINTALTIRDGTKWDLRFSSGYLRGDYLPNSPSSEEYIADFRYRLSELFQIALRFRYDAERSQFTEQTYMLRQNVGNLWMLGYYVSFRKGDSREGSTSFGVRVELTSW